MTDNEINAEHIADNKRAILFNLRLIVGIGIFIGVSLTWVTITFTHNLQGCEDRLYKHLTQKEVK